MEYMSGDGADKSSMLIRRVLTYASTQDSTRLAAHTNPKVANGDLEK